MIFFQLKILVVENNVYDQILMVEYLKLIEARITVANNGIEAIEYAKDQSFDLVLMDLNMPRMNGFETSRKIREIEDKELLPIIAVSGNCINHEEKISKEIGLNGFINKPFSAKKLIEEIEKLPKKYV